MVGASEQRIMFKEPQVMSDWFQGEYGKKKPLTSITRDLFNIFDMVAIAPGVIAGVQATSYGGRSSHRKKMLEAKELPVWISSGAGAWLFSWKRLQQGKKRVFHPVIDDIGAECWRMQNP